MAVSLLGHEVSDLCLGKPALRTVPVSATVSDALAALRRSGESYVSVWSCDRLKEQEKQQEAAAEDDSGCCRCVGKVCVGDVVCFLCKEDNLLNPGAALQCPVSVLIPEVPGLVRHLEPKASLLEAIDLILEGAQNLVIPLYAPTTNSRRKLLRKPSLKGTTMHNRRQYCWLTQEDIIRYLLNCIALFCPMPGQPINSLDIIDSAEEVLAVHYDDHASAVLPLIAESLLKQTSVAIVDYDGKLIGELSPLMLNSCDENVAAAIATLSAGDLMAYIDCGGPPEDLIQLVKKRLEERKLIGALELMDEESGNCFSSSSSSYSSSDEESGIGRSGRFGGYSARMVRRSEAIVCYPWSSLVAVMVQALARRVSYVWVVEEDGTLDGVVTFAGMMKAIRQRCRSMA